MKKYIIVYTRTQPRRVALCNLKLIKFTRPLCAREPTPNIQELYCDTCARKKK